MKIRIVLFYMVMLALLIPAHGLAVEVGSAAETPWRIRLYEAAVIPGDMVRLGDIGQVFGTPPPGAWEQLAARELWPAPQEAGKALQINRNRLEQALRQTLGDVADLCVLPKGMVLQRGGSVLREDDLRALVVKELTPQIRAMDGNPELSDFRLPAYAFLSHSGQVVELEPPNLAPGRISLRFTLKEVDGRSIRKFTGTVMLDLWREVATPTKAVNRGEATGPENVTWVRKNMVHVRGDLWDGRGGPWQATRTLLPDQPIYRTDLVPLAALRKGATVTLVYNRGAVKLAIKAEALSDGALGETIPVRNLQSGKQVYGTIMDANTVRVK